MRIDFEVGELEQFDPGVREALLRLEKQQADRRQQAEPQVAPPAGIRIKSQTSGKDEADKAALQRGSRGGINMPVYRESDLRLRKGGE